MSLFKKAGDYGMRSVVLVSIAATVGLLVTTSSQFGYLAQRKWNSPGKEGVPTDQKSAGSWTPQEKVEGVSNTPAAKV
jgi:hypothetical protein